MPLAYTGMPPQLALNTFAQPWSAFQNSGLFFSNPTQCNSNNTQHHHIHLAMWQMFKVAGAIFMVRGAFHMAPKVLATLLRVIDKQNENVLKSQNQVLKQIGIGVKNFNQFFESRSSSTHGSHLFKSLMAIIDGVLMLYVGGEVDRYFSKKTDHFKPKNNKDPEKMVDKVLLVLIATERIENLMHHLFHWIDKTPSSTRQFVYGELAALTAVFLDTGVKIASDRYKIKKNKSEEIPQNHPPNPFLAQSQWIPSVPPR